MTPLQLITKANDKLNARIEPGFVLVLDANSQVAFSDKPVFGATVTLKNCLRDWTKTTIDAGVVIGWVSHITLAKFAIFHQDQYIDASDFITAEGNQLSFTQAVYLHHVAQSNNKDRRLIRFSIM